MCCQICFNTDENNFAVIHPDLIAEARLPEGAAMKKFTWCLTLGNTKTGGIVRMVSNAVTVIPASFCTKFDEFFFQFQQLLLDLATLFG